MKLFISYSPDDKGYATLAEVVLTRVGNKAWIDHEIPAGQRWESVLKEQITSCDAFITIVSRSSLKSEWCKREFRTAKKAKLPIVPIVIEQEVLAEMPADLKHYDIVDGTLGIQTDAGFHPLVAQLTNIDQQLTAERERRGMRPSTSALTLKPSKQELDMVIPLMAQVVVAEVLPELARQTNELIGRGEWDEALTVLHQLVRDDPNNATVFSARGSVYGFIGEVDKALKDCTKAISLDATLAGAHNNLGLLYNFKDKSKEAMACFTLAIGLDPSLAGAYVSRGLLHYEGQQVNEALQDFEKAAELKPDDYSVHNNRAFVLFQLGRVEEAEVAWRVAAGLDGAESHVFANHAVALEQLGRPDEALAQYGKAVEMDRKWKNKLEQMAENYRWNAAMVRLAQSILKRLRAR